MKSLPASSRALRTSSATRIQCPPAQTIPHPTGTPHRFLHRSRPSLLLCHLSLSPSQRIVRGSGLPACRHPPDLQRPRSQHNNTPYLLNTLASRGKLLRPCAPGASRLSLEARHYTASFSHPQPQPAGLACSTLKTIPPACSHASPRIDRDAVDAAYRMYEPNIISTRLCPRRRDTSSATS